MSEDLPRRQAQMPSQDGKHEDYAIESGQRNKEEAAWSIMYQDKPEETSWDKGKCCAVLSSVTLHRCY